MKKQYQVLARKYRPQKFSELVGQPALVQTLSNEATTRNDSQPVELTSDVIEARKKIEENLQKLKRIIEGNEDCLITKFIKNIETSETIPEFSEELKQEISTQFEGIFNENDFIYILGYFFEHGLEFDKDTIKNLYKEKLEKIYKHLTNMLVNVDKDMVEELGTIKNLYQKDTNLNHPEARAKVASTLKDRLANLDKISYKDMVEELGIIKKLYQKAADLGHSEAMVMVALRDKDLKEMEKSFKMPLIKNLY